MSFIYSPEGEADGPQAPEHVGGPGDPPESKDESKSPRTATKVGAGQNGGHAQGQNR